MTVSTEAGSVLCIAMNRQLAHERICKDPLVFRDSRPLIPATMLTALCELWVTRAHRRKRSRMLSWSTLISCPISRYFVIVASIRAGAIHGLRIACRRHVCVIVCMVGLWQKLKLGARGDRLRYGVLLGVHIVLTYTYAIFLGLSSVVIEWKEMGGETSPMVSRVARRASSSDTVT